MGALELILKERGSGNKTFLLENLTCDGEMYMLVIKKIYKKENTIKKTCMFFLFHIPEVTSMKNEAMAVTEMEKKKYPGKRMDLVIQ